MSYIRCPEASKFLACGIQWLINAILRASVVPLLSGHCSSRHHRHHWQYPVKKRLKPPVLVKKKKTFPGSPSAAISSDTTGNDSITWHSFFSSIYLFIWLYRVWDVSEESRIFAAAYRIFSWGTWDLVPHPGIKPRPPALGSRSLSNGTTRKVPHTILKPTASKRQDHGDWFRPTGGTRKETEPGNPGRALPTRRIR